MQRIMAIAGLLLLTLTACNREVVTLRSGTPLAEAERMIDSADLDTFLMAGARIESDGTTVMSPITIHMLNDSTGFRLLVSESDPETVDGIEVVHGLGGFKSDYVFESRTEVVLP
jgi:hypothetical protein